MHAGQEADLAPGGHAFNCTDLGGVEELLDGRVVHVVAGDDLVASGDVLGGAGHTVQVGHRHHHRQVAHVAGLLGDDHIDRVGLEHLDGGLGGVEGHDFDLAAQALVGNYLPGALGGEHVGAEDASQVGFLLQDGFDLGLGLGGIVVVVIHAHQGHFGVVGDGFLAAFFAGVGGRDAGLDVLDVDLALAADGAHQGFAGDHAAQLVVGGDEGQREGDRAVDVIAVADEGIDGDDRQAGVAGFLQRGDHGFLVDRGQEQEVQVAAGHHGVEHGGLDGSVPVIGDLGYQLGPEALDGLFGAALHGEVERVLHAGQEADLVALAGCRLSGGFRGRRLSRGLGSRRLSRGLGSRRLGGRFGGGWLSRFFGCNWRGRRRGARAQDHRQDHQNGQQISNSLGHGVLLLISVEQSHRIRCLCGLSDARYHISTF